ncbi:MAG TPA: hypothetical protein VN915_13625 [Elusimicrobiota bacterium]|nr:hypothetical protein [Elusimicrobiota bacterium]
MSESAVAVEPSSFDPVRTGFFRFRRLGDRYLITNDFGRYRVLTDAEFRAYVGGALDRSAPLYGTLAKDGFIRDQLDFEGLAAAWRARHRFLWSGPSLHSIAPSGPGRAGMSLETAAAVADRVFESPSPALSIEFVGRPLANWPAVRLILDRARAKAASSGKELTLGLADDPSRLGDAELAALLSAGAEFRAVLPAAGASRAKSLRRLKAIAAKLRKAAAGFTVEAVVSRGARAGLEALVDECAALGARGILLKDLSPLERASPAGRKAACSPEEFLATYRAALERVLRLNSRRAFAEETARAFLGAILNEGGADSASLRSPGGEGLGELAYDRDGAIYSSVEALELGRCGDDSFRLADSSAGGYRAAVSSPSVRALAVASCLDNQPACASCAYAAYHGVSPVQSYVEQGDILGRMPTNTRCAIHKGILDLLFEKLQDEKNEMIFRGWLRQKGTGRPYPRP